MKPSFTVLTLLAGLSLSGAAQATLIDQGATAYDTDLNISWLKNANLADTESFGVSGINANGTMSWATAQSWIGAMNTANYLGYNDWRLPTTLQPDASCGNQSYGGSYGYNCTGSEMGHLFYNELGGTAGISILSSGDPDLVLFTNFQSDYYWSGTEDALYTSWAWTFLFGGGDQGEGDKSNSFYALAVRPGQVSAVPVSAVPEPGSALLVGIGLLGLLGVARRRLALR